tara:strand:- start:695 stop:3682 length:2988 start_codon:yes stop_codon:yes gene_type:complete
MAERNRGILDRLLRRRADPADVQRLNDVVNRSLDWDGKDLASLSKIQAQTSGYQKKQGAATPVDYSLLRTIANKSEVVNAILRRAVDDTLSNGYHFKLADGKEEGEAAQLEKARAFFKRPNPDDMGDEWLETMLFDLILFGDAYLELDGTEDRSGGDNGEEWNFGGELRAIWPIEADTVKIVPGPQLPAPPKMAYVQTINKKVRKFSRDKVLHIAKFKQGRGYGSSPLIPLLEVITGQLNLSNYLNALYTGTLPKTILNVGDISNAEMKAMLGLIEQQLSGGQSPFGLIAINGGSGFNMHRLIDSTREGAQLDLLYYYREEICAVFGIPPMKLGWVQTGKLANPEQQLDAWYDVVEGYHQRVSSVINNNILPLLGIDDWVFEFISIRPKQDQVRAETFNSNANAISTLRQESTISINEARSVLGLERLDTDEADNPFFISPKLQINQPGALDDSDVPDEDASEDDDESSSNLPAELNLLDLFPSIAPPAGTGESAGESPWFIEEFEVDISEEDFLTIASKRVEKQTEFEDLEEERAVSMIELFTNEHQQFSDRLLEQYGSRFRDGEVMVGKDISASDLDWSIRLLDSEIENLLDQQLAVMGVETLAGYESTLGLVSASTAVSIALDSTDTALLSYWQRRWQLPALRNTLNGFRERVIGVFQTMTTTGRNWGWAASEMKRRIDPNGDRYPKGFYTRIARTETRRVVETAHISGVRKAGIRFMQRLVEVDSQTDKDLCLPFGDAIYDISEASGILPAHPNCRCTLIPYVPPAGETPTVSEPIVPEVPMPTKKKTRTKKTPTRQQLTPPQGVRDACRTGLKLHEDGLSGSGLEGATVREAKAIVRGTPITIAKARKMIRWWGRNARFLDEPKDSPAWVAALLWGGRPGLSWSRKLRRTFEAEDDRSYAEQGSLSSGDWVGWSTDKGPYVGKVESVASQGEYPVVTSTGGTETISAETDNQVARVRVYIDNENGTYSRSDRIVPVRVAMLRSRSEPEVV